MKYGRVQFDDIERLQKDLEKLQKQKLESFLEDCAKELAARLLQKAIERTPVGKYPPSTGKVGGTLRRGWTGNKESDGASYAKNLSVDKAGDRYTITLVNPVEYATYVELGHRTANHKGWVNGRFMLAVSIQEVKDMQYELLATRLEELLKGAFL